MASRLLDSADADALWRSLPQASTREELANAQDEALALRESGSDVAALKAAMGTVLDEISPALCPARTASLTTSICLNFCFGITVFLDYLLATLINYTQFQLILL